MRRLSVKLFALVALCCAPSAAAAERVVVILSEPGGPYAQVAAEIRAALGAAADVVEAAPHDAVANGNTSRPRIIVAVGTQACRSAAASDTPVPLLCALVPRSAYERISAPVRGRVMTGIWLDQPVARQMALIRAAMPDRRDVAVLVGPESVRLVRRLEAGAATQGLHLAATEVPDAEALPAALHASLERADVLLAVPDPALYNSRTIQNIIRSAFQNRVPLVAFSDAYVKAGALLGLYSTPAQHGREAAQWIARYFEGRALPSARAARDFEVSVNRNVARALGLAVDDDDKLAERLKKMELSR